MRHLLIRARRGVSVVLVCTLTALAAPHAAAQDAMTGAQLYLRTDAGGRSCVACHGPDPGANPNNILRAADNPDALLKALNTVSAMGFLRNEIDDEDRLHLAAFLASAAAGAAPTAPQLWPRTIEMGAATGGTASNVQPLWLRAPADRPLRLLTIQARPADLIVGHDCPATLPAGAACQLRVQSRGQTGLWSRGALRIDVEGEAQALVAGVSLQGVETPASLLRWDFSAPALDFAQAPADADGLRRRTARLFNPGPMPANLSNATIVGPQSSQFQIEQRCAGTSQLQAGTGCDVTLAYRASALARAEAALQLRADQGNPPALLLTGTGTPGTPAPEVAPLEAPSGGGGCSTRPPGDPHADATALALALLAAAMTWLRRRR